MTDSYVTAKINEALKATNGDKKDAAKLIITWAVRDQPLLLGLTKTSLKELASAHIEDVLRGKKKPQDNADKAAIVLGHPKGDKRHPAKVPPPKSSERQASVMHQIVAAFKKKN